MFTIIDYHEFYYSEQRRRQSRDGVRYEHTPCAFDVGRGHRNGVEYTLYVYTVYIYIYIYPTSVSRARLTTPPKHRESARCTFPPIVYYIIMCCIVLY